jgi:GAF domain-containing protein
LEVAGVRAGVLTAVSAAPEFFRESDLRYLATVSHWVGIVAHRAELLRLTATESAARSRTAAAEELITVLAHDFRNYLSPIRGRLELLGRRAGRDGHDRYVRDAHELVASVDRLEHLVRDLLDTATLEQGLFGLSPRPVDLLELVGQTVAELAPDNRAVVRAQVDEIVVSADPSRLRQVLENLLSNALKVQPNTEPVAIEVEADESRATVTFVDRGLASPARCSRHCFSAFREALAPRAWDWDSTSRVGSPKRSAAPSRWTRGSAPERGSLLPLQDAGSTRPEVVVTGRPPAHHDLRPSVVQNGTGDRDAVAALAARSAPDEKPKTTTGEPPDFVNEPKSSISRSIAYGAVSLLSARPRRSYVNRVVQREILRQWRACRPVVECVHDENQRRTVAARR